MNWKQAFTLGLLAPGVWEGVGEATMYSYNGVVLPKLPEWDKTERWYAVVTVYVPSSTLFKPRASLYVFESYEYTKTSNGKHAIYTDNTLYWNCDIDPETISATGEWRQYYPDGNSYVGVYDSDITRWANFDLFNDDGTLFLAASDPVPVYE